MRDLVPGWGSSSDVSVKIAGLMVKEATTFFSQNASATWNEATPEQRDALIVTYYKLGRDAVWQNLQQAQANGVPYEPQIGAGGLEHLENAAQIGQTYATYSELNVGTYAGGYPAFVMSEDEASSILGHSFSGTPEDVSLLMQAVLEGQISSESYYFTETDPGRFTAPLSSGADDRIVVSSSSEGWLASVVRNDTLEETLQHALDGSHTQTVFDTGTAPWSQHIEQFDAFNRLMQTRVIADTGEKITVDVDVDDSQPHKEITTKYDKNGDAAFKVTVDDVNAIVAEVNGSIVTNIGATFGSQIGNILADAVGGNAFADVAIGTLAGAVGAHLGKLVKLQNMFANATDYNMAALDAAYHQVNTGFSGTNYGDSALIDIRPA